MGDPKTDAPPQSPARTYNGVISPWIILPRSIVNVRRVSTNFTVREIRASSI
jgi:hypothetical protein